MLWLMGFSPACCINQGKKKAKAYYASPFTTVPFFGTVPVLVTNASQEVVGAAARRGQGRVVVLGHEGMIVDVQVTHPLLPPMHQDHLAAS
jgi:hypothetical protein